MDRDLKQFLIDMVLQGHLKNTIIVLTSDHGIHATKMNNFLTHALEHRNPLNFLIFPQSYLDEHSGVEEKLLANRERMVTHMDMYKTVQSFSGNPLPSSLQTEIATYNLMEDVIPTSRSCRSAGVPGKFCGCLARK